MQEELLESPENLRAKEKSLTGGQPAGNRLTKINLVLNIVLVIGMVVLFVLFFTSGRRTGTAVPAALQKSGTNSISVVFVNIDSLNSRYEFVKKLKSDLETTGKRLQTEVLAEQDALQKEADDFQRQVANNLIPEAKAKTIYEGLMMKQQGLMEKKERYTQQVADQEFNLNIRLLDTVTNFLKRYNAIYQYDYILAHRTAGEILIANDTLDITNDVIRALNEEYKVRK